MDAIVAAKLIEDLKEPRLEKLEYNFDFLARYVHFRLFARGPVHSWTTTIRLAIQKLVEYTNYEFDSAKGENLEWSACACKATLEEGWAIDLQGASTTCNRQTESDIEPNALALAAWIGELDLVKSLHKGSDSVTFFGRPSWAAATQGHHDIVQFCLSYGALPYNPFHDRYLVSIHISLRSSSIAAAAYMGRESIVRLYLDQPYFQSEAQHEAKVAAVYAAHANQAHTFKMLLEHVKHTADSKGYLVALDYSFVNACRRGALETARLALEYGADIKQTDGGPRNCLQLAAISGSVPLVKMLLDAGASIVATDSIHSRSSNRYVPIGRRLDAYREARKRNFTEIMQLLVDAKERSMLNDKA
jgi:ankyrin repeat protein